MIAIVDYGAGNLFSVKNALDYIGAKSEITSDAQAIARADAIILPGVGAFPDAKRKLEERALDKLLITETAKKPLLGICLGMQLLFDIGLEFSHTEGLGLIPGYVDKIVAPGLKIPHMGWNSLEFGVPCELLSGVDNGSYVYFVHSYAAYTAPENVAARCDYSGKIVAMAAIGNVFGTQFHPEKSGSVGLRILKNFAEMAI